MAGQGAKLVVLAKEWASYYGNYTRGEEASVLSVPLRIRAAVSENDADAFANVFVESGSMLVDDEQLQGREEIRSYLAEAFAGPYRGARVVEEPLHVRLLTNDVALAITQGGLVLDGESELPPERESRAVWVTVKQDGQWLLACHQTSPIRS